MNRHRERFIINHQQDEAFVARDGGVKLLSGHQACVLDDHNYRMRRTALGLVASDGVGQFHIAFGFRRQPAWFVFPGLQHFDVRTVDGDDHAEQAVEEALLVGAGRCLIAGARSGA